MLFLKKIYWKVNAWEHKSVFFLLHLGSPLSYNIYLFNSEKAKMARKMKIIFINFHFGSECCGNFLLLLLHFLASIYAWNNFFSLYHASYRSLNNNKFYERKMQEFISCLCNSVMYTFETILFFCCCCWFHTSIISRPSSFTAIHRDVIFFPETRVIFLFFHIHILVYYIYRLHASPKQLNLLIIYLFIYFFFVILSLFLYVYVNIIFFSLFCILDPPVVHVSPENITVNETKDILLSCGYQANPQSLTNVKW